MDAFIQIIDSLSWPITTLIIALIFKRQISKLFLHLTTLKFKDLEATFNNRLELAEKKVKELPKPTFKETPPPETEKMDEQEETYFERLIRIAEISPRAAISEAWTEVEIAARTAAIQANFKINQTESVSKIATMFIKEGIFNEEVVVALNELRDLRNKAVHMEDFSISNEEARKYINLALNLVFELYNVGNVLTRIEEQHNG